MIIFLCFNNIKILNIVLEYIYVIKVSLNIVLINNNGIRYFWKEEGGNGNKDNWIVGVKWICKV